MQRRAMLVPAGSVYVGARVQQSGYSRGAIARIDGPVQGGLSVRIDPIYVRPADKQGRGDVNGAEMHGVAKARSARPRGWRLP